MKKEQKLSYYPLNNFNDIDFKIREVGRYWRYIEDIKISYSGGAYRVDFTAKELRENIED